MATKIFPSQIDTANTTGGTTANGSILTVENGVAYWSAIDVAELLGIDQGELVIIGYTGSAGFQGSIGSVGYFGSVGYQGSVGSEGTEGFQGAVGFSGSLGDTGYLGSAGYFGSVGYRGSEGNLGPTGYQGSVGYKGSEGYQGSVGYQGSLGDTGYRGSAGITGSTAPIPFITLSDTPQSYSGQSNRFVRVNGAGTGLYFDSNTYVTNAFGTTVNFNSNTVYAPALQNYSEKINIYGASTGIEGGEVIEVSDGNIATITLSQPQVKLLISDSGLVSGQSHSITLVVKQDAAGNNIIDWSLNTIYWPRGEGIYSPDGPTLSTEANYTDFITLMTFDAGSTWYGVISAKGFPTT